MREIGPGKLKSGVTAVTTSQPPEAAGETTVTGPVTGRHSPSHPPQGGWAHEMHPTTMGHPGIWRRPAYGAAHELRSR